MSQPSLVTDTFIGRSIPSEAEPRVHFAISRRLGVGGTAAAYLATRVAPDGESRAVVKIILPEVVQGHGETAATVVRKESVALGRLNEKVPPTPFVVRLMDVGTVAHFFRGQDIVLPWLAIEYVEGGIEGTTLEEREARSIELTGAAFDRERAARAVSHICEGLRDVHSVGVIHRDLTPNNILCCGFGESEMFKLSDFGIARPAGVRDTFGPSVIGTPGYISPEQISEGKSSTAGDIFSLACLIYFVLTGEHLFDISNAFDLMRRVGQPERRSVLEGAALVKELKNDRAACQVIDQIIARATAMDPTRRPEDPREIGNALAPLLLKQAGSGSRRERATLMSAETSPGLTRLSWVVRHPPGDERIVHSAGWDADGHCLAATTRGLEYWNGSEWKPAPALDLPLDRNVRFVRRIGPGRWLVGGDNALLAEYSHSGISRVMRGKDPSVSFLEASGNVADLAVVIGAREGSAPELLAAVGGRWLKPFSLPELAYISGLVPIDEERWLVIGRTTAGSGFVAIYSPLTWSLEFLGAPETRAWVACAARIERDVVVAVGAEGSVLRIERGVIRGGVIPDRPNLACVSVDVLDREWAGASGALFCSVAGGDWARVYSNASWNRPFVSVFADVSSVIALSVDGGVLECRPGSRDSSLAPARQR